MSGAESPLALFNPRFAALLALPLASQGGYNYFPVLYIAAGAAAFYAIKRASELSVAHRGLVFAYVPNEIGATTSAACHVLSSAQSENGTVRVRGQDPSHSGIDLRRKAATHLLYERRIMHSDQNPAQRNARADENVFWGFGTNLGKAAASACARSLNAEVMCFSSGEAHALSSASHAFSPDGAKALLLESCGYLVITHVPICE